MATVSILNLLTGSSTPLLASGDVVPFVDISDSTQSPGGSTVKATLTQFFAAIPVPIIVTNTGTQLQLKYDGSNHVTVAVSSAGAVTLNATGASAGFTFSDAVTVNAVVSVAVAAGTPIAADFTGAAAVNPLYRGKRGGTDRWFIGVDASDQFAVLDATGTTANLTITDAGAGTFRAGITATTGAFSGTVTGTNLVAGATSVIQFATRTFLQSPSDGSLIIRNAADDAYADLTVNNLTATTGTFSGAVRVDGLIQLAGTTNSFPALKRAATTIQARLADDSGYAAFTAGAILATNGLQSDTTIVAGQTLQTNLGVTWDLGAAAAVSPTSPNRTLRVKVGGTDYYIAAKTTND